MNELVANPISLIANCSDQLITDKLINRQTLIRAFELMGDVILDQNIIYLATFLENAAIYALADAYYSLDEIGYAKYKLNDSFGQKPFQSYAWSKKLVMDSIAVVKRFAQIFQESKYKQEAQIVFETTIRQVFRRGSILTSGQRQELC